MYILLILAGCTDMSVEDISTKSNEKFYATIEQTDSRTYVDGQIRLRWTAEDCITLFRKSTYNREYMFTGTTGANAGGFRQKSVDDDFWYGADVPYNYAIYPHSSTTQLDETDYFFTFTMPAEQTYAENSFGIGANTMVAVSESGQLTFKNVGSYLRVRLYGEDVSVSSITLTSKGNEAIAGTAKITPSKNSNPTCEMTGTGKSIRLTCPEPVTVSTDANNPTDFWIVVPPVTLESGFSVTVENSTGDTQVYDVNKSFTFERNMYTDMKREIMIKNAPIYHVATAGTLSDLISDEEKTLITAMKVTGYLNGKDITTICRMAGNSWIFDKVSFKVGCLRKIDLSEAILIEDGSYYHYGTNSGQIQSNEIGEGMFMHCDSLETIVLPKETETIRKNAFFGCRSLISAVLSDKVKVIGENAFYTSSLKSIELPQSLETIGDDAFMWCKNLRSIIIPANVTSIGKRAFYQCDLNSVDIYGVCSIGDDAFTMSNITTLNIHNELRSIGNSAFSNCKFASLIIPSLEKIDDYAFYSCGNLEYLSINNVKYIGELAFFGHKISKLTIPKQVESIGEYAFSSNYLEEVHCKAVNPPSIPEKCFGDYYYGTMILYVPIGSKELYASAEGWERFKNIIEE